MIEPGLVAFLVLGYSGVGYLVAVCYAMYIGLVYFSVDKAFARGVVFGAVWPVYLPWLLMVGVWKLFVLAFGKET